MTTLTKVVCFDYMLRISAGTRSRLFTGVSSITFPQMCQDINSICCEIQPGKLIQQHCKSIYKLLHINEGSGTNSNSRTSVNVLFHHQIVQMGVLY